MAATANDFPIVIDKTRTQTVGGQRLESQRLRVDMGKQGLADVRAYMRALAESEAEAQRRAGNPPTLVEVDAKTDKRIEDVSRKIEILFGVTLPQAAMREVEIALQAAIDRSTKAHSGRLRAVLGTWQWLFVPAGFGTPRIVTSATAGLTFNQGDRLVLKPTGVPYATITNYHVAHSGRLNPKARKVRGVLREPARRLQNAGFLFHAAEAVRKRAAFKLFHVKVVFTKAHAVPGEVMTREQGTGLIQISARVRRVDFKKGG